MDIAGLLSLVIYLAVAGLLFWLVWWLLAQFPLPEPFATVIRVVLAIVAFIIVAYALLSIVPGGHVPRLR